jgi:glyoxylase-like metal-dependent hydrolase (beta-lactamase superfamily II)
VAGHADRLFLLQYGAERVTKALSLRGGDQTLYWEPLFGALVETGAGWVLLDTGMGRPALDSADVTAAYAVGGDHSPNRDTPWHLHPAPPRADAWTWGLTGDPMATALATVGLTPADLALAAVSHLHVDHSGGVPLLAAAGVPVALQRGELDFARSGAVGVAEGFHAPDWSAPHTRWRLLDGDAELAPGVWAVGTPGHTPGHMSFRVDLPGTGTWLFAADAADLAQNVLDGTPCGSAAAGTEQDERRAAESLHRLLELAADTDARLVPGHDQLVLSAVRHPPGGHR